MKLAIMQPYLFPYLGYFQLIRAVDAFVVYDDVNYIKGGWINRNFILANCKPQRITLELHGASSNKLINQVSVGDNNGKLLKTISQQYSKAPYFPSVFPIIEEILSQDEKNLSKFIDYSLKIICEYLGLNPHWFISSSLNKDNTLRGQDKVLAICDELQATHYINVPGGKELYDKEAFERNGIELSFICQRNISYFQFTDNFIPNLSIIDVIMFNDRCNCLKLLESYELI